MSAVALAKAELPNTLAHAFARLCALSAEARSAKADPFAWLASLRSLASSLAGSARIT